MYSGTEHWIDTHSVTCALCGTLADERETISLSSEELEERAAQPGSDIDPTAWPEGEAHEDCWEDEKDE